MTKPIDLGGLGAVVGQALRVSEPRRGGDPADRRFRGAMRAIRATITKLARRASSSGTGRAASRAWRTKPGHFEAAHGGTLFLDEVAELPIPMQVTLLRAIQEKCVRPIGAQQEVPVDARILSTTHKDLATIELHVPRSGHGARTSRTW